MVNRDLDNALQEKLLILTLLILADGSMNEVCRGHSPFNIFLISRNSIYILIKNLIKQFTDDFKLVCYCLTSLGKI